MPEPTTSSESEVASQQACSSSGLRIGGMCLNWKVLGGLAAVGVGIWMVAPNLIAAASPLLILAACPLSMWLMMRGMSRGQQTGASGRSGAQIPAQTATETTRPRDLGALTAEHARLTAELEALESDVARAKSQQNGSPVAPKQPSPSPASGSPKASGEDAA